MALPRAKMLLGFKSLFAVLCSHITVRKFLAVSSSPLAALKSGKGFMRVRAGGALKGCGCVGHPQRGLVLLFGGGEEGEMDRLAATSPVSFVQFVGK